MKQYRYIYSIGKKGLPPLKGNTLFLDIETTGFSRETTFLTIIGLAWQEDDKIVIEQWLNECSQPETDSASVQDQSLSQDAKVEFHPETEKSRDLWSLLEDASMVKPSSYQPAHSAFQVKTNFLHSKKHSRHLPPPLSMKERGFLEEKLLLNTLEDFLQNYEKLPTLIHYNGTTFDLPYLKAKYEQYGLTSSLSDCSSLDLYRYAKKYKNFLHPGGLKQKNMEEVFGLFREDTLSGEELIQTYEKGIQQSNKRLLDLYLLHNKEDMEGMVFLQNLLQLDQVFDGDFTIEKWDENKDLSSLFVKLSFPLCLNRSLSLDLCGIHLHMEGNDLFLKIPVNNLEAKYFYPDYKNYYYLPLEDRAIHKSVASFVEKEFRKKATKETCYMKKTASFYPLPLPSKKKQQKECLEKCCLLQLFYQEFGDTKAYLLCSSLHDSQCKKQYIKALLLAFLE
ncbi:MAG: ribonuclease H-like domain-containing protein [Lachnospiraceae bacterium]|nr:ribonuclease H-like domain-containing protein [Lachnospiraceae bacterium]